MLVPVVSLEAVCDAPELPKNKRGLLRSRDQLHPYLYLPAVPGTDEGELVALLFRPATVSEEFLRERRGGSPSYTRWRVGTSRSSSPRTASGSCIRAGGRGDAEPYVAVAQRASSSGLDHDVDC